MFNNRSINVVESALNALWIRQKAISNNIANYETPGYRAKQVSFEEVLNKNLVQDGTKNTQLKISVKEDPTITERLDGNNVDIEKEQLALWDTYAQYSYLTNSISGTYSKLRYVINNTGK